MGPFRWLYFLLWWIFFAASNLWGNKIICRLFFYDIFFLKQVCSHFSFWKLVPLVCHNFCFPYLLNSMASFWYTYQWRLYFFVGYGMKFRTSCLNDVCGNFFCFIDHWNYGHNYDQSQIGNFKEIPAPHFPFPSIHLLDTRFSVYFTDVKTCDQAIFAKYFYNSLTLFFFCNTWKWWSVWCFF